jgi:hypothetical protein
MSKLKINITLVDGTEILGKETTHDLCLSGQERFVGFYDDEDKTSVTYISTKRIAEFSVYTE